MASKSDLARFFETKKSEKRILGHVERMILARPAGDRSTTVIHPSEVIKRDFCRRQSFFLLSGVTKIAEKIPLRLQNIFDEGHMIHAKWQAYFQELGVLHGQFKCDICDKMTWGTSPEACEHCGAGKNKLVYAEVTLSHDPLRIKGHTDGWVRGIDKDVLIEIKSVGPGTIRSEAPQLMQEADGDFMKAWKNIRRPFSPHILQGQMYLELMDRMGHRNEDGSPIDEIVFIYELKADQDFKEFTIKRDFELVRHVFENCQKVVDAVEAGVEPECNNNPGGTCKYCDAYAPF